METSTAALGGDGEYQTKTGDRPENERNETRCFSSLDS
jgi:hypothetical protein